MIASLLYPYDADASGLIEGWLSELERQEHIQRYTIQEHTYLQICNWLTHQKIDKPSPSKFPPLPESPRILANIRESSTTDRRTKDQGEEGTGTCSEGESSSIDPNMMARGLCERLNLSRGMGKGTVYEAVYDLAKLELTRGGDLETLCDRLEEAYQRWLKEPGLDYRWGPAKFFAEGHWQHPENWPRGKNGKKSTPEWDAFIANGGLKDEAE